MALVGTLGYTFLHLCGTLSLRRSLIHEKILILSVSVLVFTGRSATHAGVYVRDDDPCLSVHVLVNILACVSTIVNTWSIDFGRLPPSNHRCLLRQIVLLVKSALYSCRLVKHLLLLCSMYARLLRLRWELLQACLAVRIPIVTHHLELLVLQKTGPHRVFRL